MRKIIRYIISSLIVLTVFISVKSVSAAVLDFDPDSTTVQSTQTFEVDVNVEAGTQQVAGTDIYIIYDPAYLQMQTVTDDSFFPIVNEVPSSGKLYISGVVTAQGDYKVGSGTVATVTFKALQEGSSVISFDCDSTKTETSKIVQNDVNATNIIDCTALKTHTVTISASASAASSTSSQLPKSGVVEDTAGYAVWGGILIALGGIIRILLRVI